MYAALHTMPIPERGGRASSMPPPCCTSARGDGHIAALMVEGVARLEGRVLLALDMDMPAEKFGRIHHLPAAQIEAVIDGMRDRGLIGNDGWLSGAG